MPTLLDLFSGAGGCAMGYMRAGFDVTGVDIKTQPRYPGRFIQGDALEFVDRHGHEFDAIHASPPCQAFTSLRRLGKGAGENAPDLVSVTRTALMAAGRPWVMENVVGSPLKTTLLLCGSMFGLGVRRHRLFETSLVIFGQPCRHAGQPRPIAVYGDHAQDSANRQINRARSLAEGREAMGIDWMEWHELTQSIPPAYTEYIGWQLMAAVLAVAC